MLPERSELDVRISELAGELAGGPAPDRARELRVELAARLVTRVVEFGGTVEDRLRAERLAEQVLADEAVTPRQRQAMAMVAPMFTVLGGFPAAAALDHGLRFDVEALPRTDADAALAAMAGLDSLDTSRLDLAAPLSLRRILEDAAGRRIGAPGPTVVLAACDSDLTRLAADEVLTVATAFLAAGAATVVGARWAVDDQLTAVAMFALHHFLAVDGRPAADALRAAQLWLLDPGREPLPGMPATLRGRLRRRLLADASVWAAFAHHGW